MPASWPGATVGIVNLEIGYRCISAGRRHHRQLMVDVGFRAVRSAYCNSAMWSKAADPSQSLNGWIQSDSDLKRLIPIINIC